MESHMPFSIPRCFDNTADLLNQVFYVLTIVEQATADEIAVKLEVLNGARLEKRVIAGIRMLLSELHTRGLISGDESDGELNYHLNGHEAPVGAHWMDN